MPTRKAEDLSGKKFNRLTVIERAEDYPVKGIFWKCICDCGKERIVRGDRLKNGTTKSCGCYSTEKLIKYNKEKKANDLTGQKFGRWTILEKTDKRDSGSIVWLCECECGTKKEIRGTSLVAGETKSCGCIQKIDIANQRFGKLIAIKPTEESDLWLCKCDCGNEKIVSKRNLLRGHTISCGCLKRERSLGEQKIHNLLIENNIPFEEEKIFENFYFDNDNKKRIPRFDFYINNSYLIEFDGKQHLGIGGWGEPIENIQERDNIKNEYCKKHNIPLIRIPYTHLNELCLNDLLLETSQFIVN